VYQLHVAVAFQSGFEVSTVLQILVNGTLRCSGSCSLRTNMGRPYMDVPMILFDILHILTPTTQSRRSLSRAINKPV
jgi:hypothetical protein